jgi:hypothetical protein
MKDLPFLDQSMVATDNSLEGLMGIPASWIVPEKAWEGAGQFLSQNLLHWE